MRDGGTGRPDAVAPTGLATRPSRPLFPQPPFPPPTTLSRRTANSKTAGRGRSRRVAAPPKRAPRSTRPLGIERRTLTVFASLLFGMSVTYGALRFLEPGTAPPIRGVTLMSIERSATTRPEDKLFQPADRPAALLDADAAEAAGDWDVIVIHDSQVPVGSYASLDTAHRAAGRAGCGYHFVINNGSEADDGRIEMGYRWKYQELGDFFEGPEAAAFNRRFRTIGICLVGDLDAAGLTEAQERELTWLVTRLQSRFGIPTDRVFIDVGSDGDGVGMHFPHRRFRQTLEASQNRLAGRPGS